MSVRVPAVSVIVPAWGVAHLVGEALSSLTAQTFVDWEAIVVDDGAPDIAAAVAPFAAADPRIRFVPTPHGGVSAARNHAIAAARAPLLALLDGDDAYEPDYLARMVTAIDADPALGVVTCDATFVGGTARDGQLFSAYLPQAVEPTLDAVLARRFNVFIGSVVRADAMHAAGGFDEALPAAEDLDLWIRLLEAGWRLGCLSRPLVRYRRRPGSLSSSPARLNAATATVYEQAAERLVGRPEGATARAMLARMRREAAWAQGEDLVIAGRVGEGLRMLRAARADRRSLRWRLAMALFRLVPGAAGPLIARSRAQPPA